VTVLIKQVFDAFGYRDLPKQVALIRIAAYCGCFAKTPKNKLVTDEEANQLLSIPFSSFTEGVNWVVDIFQKKMLRANRPKEGIGEDKNPIINVKRWDFALDDNHELLKLFKTLELVDTVSWPEEKTSHVVLHGGISKFLLDRMNFINDFCGRLYYLTNPRGLFNDEAFLAEILADWFEMPNNISAIETVLSLHKDIRTSKKNWLQDLGDLKQEILIKLGVSSWPLNKGWYYKNPEPFDTAAKSERRQSLAGWPTVMDLVEYLLLSRAAKNHGCFNHIELIPIYSVRPGRVSNTEDTIEDWYTRYGQHLPKGTLVTFVSNNSNGLHYISYQDAITKKVISNIEPTWKKIRYITVGLGSDEISLFSAADVIAKIFFSQRNEVIRRNAFIPQKLSFPSLFQDRNESLAISMIELAQFYCDENHRSYVKAAGIINFVISFLEQRNQIKYVEVIATLKRCAMLNLKQYLLFKSADNLRILQVNFKSKLQEIREKLLAKFIDSCQNKNLLIELYKSTQETMDRFFQEIITHLIDTLGQPPCHFTYAFLGSNARGQATHCSDIEFIIIVSQSNSVVHEYFQDLTQLMLIVVANIGETILPAFNIKELSSVYDDITPHAYSFDGNLEQASKTPLGSKSFGKRVYRLIGTPNELAQFISADWYRYDRYFPQLMRLTRYVYGDYDLYNDFINILKNRPEVSNSGYGAALFVYDCEKYSQILSFPPVIIDHKKHYFRPILALIDDLFIMCGFVNNHPDKFTILNKVGIISDETFAVLDKILMQALFIRYFRHNSYIIIKALPLEQQKPLLADYSLKRFTVERAQKLLLQQFSLFKQKIDRYDSEQLLKEEELSNEYKRRINHPLFNF
jgi:hypothetical protein